MLFSLALVLAAPNPQPPQPPQSVDPLLELIGMYGGLQASGPQSADAKRVSGYVGAFPPQAQQQILQMVQALMQLPAADLVRLVQTFQQQGGEAAYSVFPAQVQQQLRTLGKQLELDPAFASANNIAAMMQMMQAVSQMQAMRAYKGF